MSSRHFAWTNWKKQQTLHPSSPDGVDLLALLPLSAKHVTTEMVLNAIMPRCRRSNSGNCRFSGEASWRNVFALAMSSNSSSRYIDSRSYLKWCLKQCEQVIKGEGVKMVHFGRPNLRDVYQPMGKRQMVYKITTIFAIVKPVKWLSFSITYSPHKFYLFLLFDSLVCVFFKTHSPSRWTVIEITAQKGEGEKERVNTFKSHL